MDRVGLCNGNDPVYTHRGQDQVHAPFVECSCGIDNVSDSAKVFTNTLCKLVSVRLHHCRAALLCPVAKRVTRGIENYLYPKTACHLKERVQIYDFVSLDYLRVRSRNHEPIRGGLYERLFC